MKKLMALVLTVCLLLAAMPAAMADVMLEIASTPLYGSSSNKLNNLQLAVDALDGAVIYYGETFSFNDTIGPRTKEQGYRSARNGRGVNVIAGGVSQLATTLYMAARESAYIEFEPFETYEEDFAEWYVEDGYDAIITDYAAGKDFSFTSWYEGAIYVSAWMSEGYVYCMLDFDMNGAKPNLLARSSTPVFGSVNKQFNITKTAELLNGVQVGFGDTFSFNWLVGPRTKEAGFRSAENGRGVKVYGGGVAQVASTIYLAVKDLECVAVTPVKTYGEKFVDGYVADPEDAVVTDYNAGTDFSFTYWGTGTLTVMVYQDGDRLVCEIYED